MLDPYINAATHVAYFNLQGRSHATISAPKTGHSKDSNAQLHVRR